MNKITTKINTCLVMAASLALSACSNVKSDWDCPKQNGIGCINIEEADNLAMQRIRDNQEHDAGEIKHNVSGTKVREIWVAPGKDKFGKPFDASIIRYIG
ncbi:MAG: hypothetical protein ACK5WS_03090 [Alphaproteobacteria bacterium]|jgi:hypothetical protein|nr:hypothetical protein [Candidatus Jidaibacter sp.]